MISLLILIIAVIFSDTHAFTHQIDYNDERGEYCYKESFNLGTCLGRKQEESLDVTEEQIVKCMECSGNFNGNESCEELKALNKPELGSNGTDSSINWNESFCETYNICVEENCPKECWREQDAWIECLVIELDCDWRCPGSSWLMNSRETGNGMMFNYDQQAAAISLRVGRVSAAFWVLLVGVFAYLGI